MGLTHIRRQRVAVSIGSGMGGFATFESSALRKFRNQPVPPFTVPRTMANSAAAWIAIKHRLKGVNLTCSTACSSGANAIGMALDLLRAGRADAVIAGGAEACVLPLTMNGFEILHALTTDFNTDPARASRPFAKGRDGFVMSEGAGILILERGRTGKASRGENIRPPCWLWTGMRRGTYRNAGHGGPGSGNAKRQSRMQAWRQIPSTISMPMLRPLRLETLWKPGRLKVFLGTGRKNIAISATKSLLGHSIGASAAIGSIATIMALHTGTVHPTINLDEADPECDLDYTPNVGAAEKPTTGLCNAFGFGGNNASIVFTTLE